MGGLSKSPPENAGEPPITEEISFGDIHVSAMKITQAPMTSKAVIAGCCDCATCAAAPIQPVGGGPGCRKKPAFDAAFQRFPAMFDPVVSTPDGERFAVPAACCPSIPKLSMIERIQNVGPLPPKLTNGDINNA